MRDLNYQLKGLARANRDGSYGTQAVRERLLSQIADQLHELGYRHLTPHSLKPKHVKALVEVWQHGDSKRDWQPVSVAVIKNRLSVMRWWASKVNKPGVIARSNRAYGIADRRSVPEMSKAKILDEKDRKKVTDPYVRMSLALQRAFGLRREEAIKFIPAYADRGDRIVLKPSWTKGGKERAIPVRTAEQRAVLAEAHKLAGRGSLIPGNKKYIQQLWLYEKQTARAGLSAMHGLRHEYAQRRYEELTGWKAPAAGGPGSKDLTAEQKRIDQEARLTISRELGHERTQVTTIYLFR